MTNLFRGSSVISSLSRGNRLKKQRSFSRPASKATKRVNVINDTQIRVRGSVRFIFDAPLYTYSLLFLLNQIIVDFSTWDGAASRRNCGVLRVFLETLRFSVEPENLLGWTGRKWPEFSARFPAAFWRYFRWKRKERIELLINGLLRVAFGIFSGKFQFVIYLPSRRRWKIIIHCKNTSRTHVVRTVRDENILTLNADENFTSVLYVLCNEIRSSRLYWSI